MRAGLKVRLSEAKIAALEDNPQSTIFSPLERLVIRFTDEVVRNVKASDPLFTELLAQLDKQRIAELILTIGFYMTAGRFLENLEVEIEN